MHGIVLALHIAVGAAALLSFWTAALARKGSPTHRLAGRIYLLAMTGILVTALPLALAYFGRGQPLFGVFFLYLMLLVGGSVVVAPRAVRLKQDFEAFRGGIYPLLAWALVAGGAATAAIGLWSSQTLLLAFGLVGALRSVHMLRLRRLPAPPPGWWLREHFTAMIANGVATHIAFLGIGLARVLPPRIMELHLSWFIPLAAGISTITWLSRWHRRRFAARPKALAPRAAASSASG